MKWFLGFAVAFGAAVNLLLPASVLFGDTVRAEPASAPATVLNPDMFKLPSSTLDAKAFSFAPRKHVDSDSNFSIPNTIDFGTSVLRFDTDRSALNATRRVDDSVSSTLDPSLRNPKARPPTYFGLTISAPTH